MKSSFLLLFIFGVTANIGRAYPEFQIFVAKKSGRTLNCAMCHMHSDGPEGTALGQIGRLTPKELERLGRARSAMEPGQVVDSPILNAFGNHIIHSVGRKKFNELKAAPEALAELLPQESDLDQDGIPDAREYLEGTHPVNRNDGNPLSLLKHNFKTNAAAILLTLAATVSGMWGLSHLLHGFAKASRVKNEEDDDLL